jgi:hypothetical protein
MKEREIYEREMKREREKRERKKTSESGSKMITIFFSFFFSDKSCFFTLEERIEIFVEALMEWVQ